MAVHSVALEAAEFLPVKDNRESKLSAAELIDHPLSVLTYLFFGVIGAVEVYSYVKPCLCGFFHIAVVVLVLDELAVAVSHTHKYEFNSGLFYCVIVDIGLPC